MKKRTEVAIWLTCLAAAVGVMSLSGCTKEGAEASSNNTLIHYTFVQELPDGRSVLCVWTSSGSGGGLSCDWATAR